MQGGVCFHIELHALTIFGAVRVAMCVCLKHCSVKRCVWKSKISFSRRSEI